MPTRENAAITAGEAVKVVEEVTITEAARGKKESFYFKLNQEKITISSDKEGCFMKALLDMMECKKVEELIGKQVECCRQKGRAITISVKPESGGFRLLSIPRCSE